MIAGSHVHVGVGGATDLLGGLNLGSTSPNPASRTDTPAPPLVSVPSGPFDAVIAVGVLIKGATMHFEYICESVSHALMRVQLDTGVPVIFGVLTALNDDQALERAGLGRAGDGGHNHGRGLGPCCGRNGCADEALERGQICIARNILNCIKIEQVISPPLPSLQPPQP